MISLGFLRLGAGPGRAHLAAPRRISLWDEGFGTRAKPGRSDIPAPGGRKRITSSRAKPPRGQG